MFGPHLVLDLYGCDRRKLGDVQFIKQFLEDFPTKLSLRKISEAIVNFYDTPTPGISGFVLISESHITIHTFIHERYAAIDIFSCKPFDERIALQEVQRIFEPELIEKKLIDRGKYYPIEVREKLRKRSE